MSEFHEHQMVCNYIRSNYPHVIFLSDLNGVKMTMGLATRIASLKSRRGIPDLIVLEPSKGKCGLMIELKKTGEKITKKDGTDCNTHITEQRSVIDELVKKGYVAGFALGFEAARQMVDEYFRIN